MTTPQYVAQLKKARRPVAGPIIVRTLVDTGASCCALDYGIITRLSLMQTGLAKIHTSTTGLGCEERALYDVSIFIGTPDEVASFTVSVVGADLASEGFLAIIGWDILKRCVLTCDGPQNVFRLDF